MINQPVATTPESTSSDRWSMMPAEALVNPGSSEAFAFPSPDFWREEAQAVRGSRYLAFDLPGAVYALPLTNIREVDRVPAVTHLPNVPEWLLGAANLRGEILSVVDLAGFLGLGATRISRESRLLACRAGKMEAGLVVERLKDIRELADAAIRPPTGDAPGRAARFLSGAHAADGRLTLLLDAARMLHSPELRRFE